jgi:hypothetical protein
MIRIKRQRNQFLVVPMLLLTLFLLDVTSYSLFAKASPTNQYVNHNRLTRFAATATSTTSTTSSSTTTSISTVTTAEELAALCNGGAITSLLEKKDNSTNSAAASYEFNSTMLMTNNADSDEHDGTKTNVITISNRHRNSRVYEDNNDGLSTNEVYAIGEGNENDNENVQDVNTKQVS